jgi:hypothetical protein
VKKEQKRVFAHFSYLLDKTDKTQKSMKNEQNKEDLHKFFN